MGNKYHIDKKNITFGAQVIISGQVVPNEPFDENTQLALDIWANALKEVYGK